MTSQALTLIATHPLVQLCFCADTYRFAFARYFVAMQEKSVELLSMRDTIERYITSSYREIAEAMEVSP